MPDTPTVTPLVDARTRLLRLIEAQPDDMFLELYQSNETGAMRSTGFTVADLRAALSNEGNG